MQRPPIIRMRASASYDLHATPSPLPLRPSGPSPNGYRVTKRARRLVELTARELSWSSPLELPAPAQSTEGRPPRHVLPQ